MSRKAWVITSQDGKIVDIVNARKKIAFVDTYMCHIFTRDFGGDPAELQALVKHVSGTETVLQNPPHVFRAKLGQVDDKTYASFDKSDDMDW